MMAIYYVILCVQITTTYVRFVESKSFSLSYGALDGQSAKSSTNPDCKCNAFCTAIYLKVCVLTLYLDISRKDKYKLPCIFGGGINLKSCIQLQNQFIATIHQYQVLDIYYLLLLTFVTFYLTIIQVYVFMCKYVSPLLAKNLQHYQHDSLTAVSSNVGVLTPFQSTINYSMRLWADDFSGGLSTSRAFHNSCVHNIKNTTPRDQDITATVLHAATYLQ